jgi:hypothetical protein
MTTRHICTITIIVLMIPMLEEGLIKCKVNQDPNNPDEYYWSYGFNVFTIGGFL